ncbi:MULTISPECIES: magnesium transporter CorA family protein [Hallerella]|jgi:magnesium transporter|uniref:Magnesium transporter n=1 Tax=Hallerella succinigenes TaxID=1896222 RepID=A0A2M9A611_9BACT|nr:MULTISPECIES: magnesium transporter CorA family protein [Hallerella]MBS7392738.1 magnesium transporter CorA family protein [Fibrobacter sp.]MCI6872932.1 magnesium transporter CorA family protein [Hallerella sp.]MCR5028379.1 magnesium transporter CorA family protein [Fibrobacter sp.]MDD6092679.1 magnesium transporter CorA family protein [Hallerella succinigenes]MDY5030211.1 magnesium transporter CorA family protein [Hallerella succinigenes]
MLKYYKIENGRITKAPDEDSADIVLMDSPSQEQRGALVKKYEIAEHTIASAFDNDELSRVEYDDDFTTIVFKKPRNYTAEDNFEFRVESFGIFVFEDWVLLLSDSEIPLMDSRRFSKIDSLNTFVVKLLNYSVYHFNEHLKIINRISEELEDKLQNTLDNKYLLYMFTLNKGLIYYVSALNSNEALLKKLQMGRGMQFDENERELLDDVVIENRQSLQQAEIYANILASLMDARASVVNNNMNELMRTLNIVTIAITIPTFVASIFGMNVKFPFGLGEGNPFSFWIIVAIFVLSVAGVLLVWRKRK